eukprot:NODE_109_length_3629_cov_7.384923.p1 GENE.NODE_109_length_3629_cov_7.384923~~NODE_109_length_3629_cov_7.384923.p1  ORF type:complete len:1157 (+),score=349.21 NODE_109_length_3629_cov_7.384923:68-3538(+)
MQVAPWEQFFWTFIFVGPYILLFSWSMRFWIRGLAGFMSLSELTSQTLSLFHKNEDIDVFAPFGSKSSTYIGFCMAAGVAGGFFAAFSENLGLFFLQAWGTYCLYVFFTVRSEQFNPPAASTALEQLPFLPHDAMAQVFLCIVSVFLLLMVLRFFVSMPRTPLALFAALTGAAFGSHSIVEVAYYMYGTAPDKCQLRPECLRVGLYTGKCCPTGDGTILACCTQTDPAYGMLLTNRQIWCSDPATCKVFYGVFLLLCGVSLIGQYFFYIMAHDTPRQEFAPVSNDPNWKVNLRTPRTAWVFLFLVVCSSSLANFVFAQAVNWTGETNFLVGLAYILVYAFALWNVIEFFWQTIFFHVIRLICDMPSLPSLDFKAGIPARGRTILAYCLLSKQKSTSEETFQTAMKSHLDNLDPNGNITTCVVSVTSAISIVQCEMSCRDDCRNQMRDLLRVEQDVVLRLHAANDLMHGDPTAVQRLANELVYGHVRARFWVGLLWRTLEALPSTPEQSLEAALTLRIEEQVINHFMYLHRTCRILKKPGQYQDVMILSYWGRNTAYTYLKKDYGEMGREEGSICFGFGGNLEDDAPDDLASSTPSMVLCGGSCGRNSSGEAGGESSSSSSSGNMRHMRFQAAIAELERKGSPDMLLLKKLGSSERTRYHYTMVLDSDTGCPPRSIRHLLEVAEEPRNQRHGIINGNLAHDFRSSSDCTWHMWRSALIEVSKVNLLRSQYVIYDRVGFYGKGLVRNQMYIDRVIGKPNQPLEALPIEILSHDTVEAKLMQPCIAYQVTLFEDVARNPISGLAQSTRWLFGEVRNTCYHDGPYKFAVSGGASLFARITTCKRRKPRYVRWHDVPCSVGAGYISHLGFRGYHAGAAVLLINISGTILARWRLGLELTDSVGLNTFSPEAVLIFVVLALFVIPNALMILGYLPSLRLCQRLCCRRNAVLAGSVQSGGSPSMSMNDAASPQSESPRPVVFLQPATDVESVVPSSLQLPASAFASLGQQRLISPLPERRNRRLRCVQLIVLVLLEILLSVLLYAPELIEGPIRLIQGIRAQITGKQTWVPQDQVEKDVEANLSLLYVFRKTWLVCLVGITYTFYVCWFQMVSIFTIVLCSTWILHPVTTFFACKPVPEALKPRWIWAWIMELRELKNAEFES